MADSMDWTPTGPLQSLKRRVDGSLVTWAPQTPNYEQSIPGAWPQTPDDPPTFLQPPQPARTQQSRPISETYILRQAKRLCGSLKACFSYTATSMTTIVRSVRQRQTQRQRTVARPRQRAASKTTRRGRVGMESPITSAHPTTPVYTPPIVKKLPLLEIPYADLDGSFRTPNTPAGIQLQDELNKAIDPRPKPTALNTTARPISESSDPKRDYSDLSDNVPAEWWPVGFKNLTLTEVTHPQPTDASIISKTSASPPATSHIQHGSDLEKAPVH